MTPEDLALDALAAALAPRVLREVRALIEAERAGADDEALGIAVLAQMGYAPGPCPQSLSGSAPNSGAGLPTRNPKRSRR